ncbi:uncharacterized protein LOC111705355 [Eurytemora carolleeae]|uniref:uncharacterized protein LOC111705355 n=1 Tax=Eurytemora carolleeae TaxID=1294199 RepID=UPI000C793328|nr:uncharacterized protein LOC111705355 [Eurytemora carolleeae]|eukprot:XP_023333627.1 uncharacterized protein LOC111705355 [Eurytemora affinis]
MRRMSYYSSQLHDMSSYVAVSGTPNNDCCTVFGLTPQEVRYLKGKFPSVRSPNGSNSHQNHHSQQSHQTHQTHPTSLPQQHGIRLEATAVVVLNALGYIGFKVITTCGDSKEYLWTLERNLDVDHQFKALEESYNE